MSNTTNYPSCIKIPVTSSRQNNAMVPKTLDLNEVLALNRELITLANQAFGEGKWNHSVTNQTIDFVELYMGKYVCGCATFVKIQLHNGTYHEDMAYYSAEGATKGLAIHSARIVSLTEAFKKVLMCFNYFIEHDIEKLLTKSSNSDTNNIQIENVECSLSDFNSDMLESYAQASPSKKQKTNVEENKPGSMFKSKSSCNQGEHMSVPKLETKTISGTLNTSKSTLITNTNNVKGQLQSDCTSSEKVQEINQKEQERKTALSEEELLRMERKRKQMEKKAEFKRLMLEREQQKKMESMRPNPKY
ncbi:uncharacterized protein LOC117225900 [Megalopta genalis]|uniref:uncharacterized protein LOC117225900 n=1 Tax=Megalopta genalis TaxID=115081 RepID=UPI003FD5A90B